LTIAVVIGGQFGSEGKGKVTAHFCRFHDYNVAIRCGGPNSGHTIYINKKPIVLRQIPAGIVNPESTLYLAAGCIIDVDVLLEEINKFNLLPERFGIDRNAVIIDDGYDQEEINNELGDRIGSTCLGTGIAVAKRVLRSKDVKLAKDIPEFKQYITNVSKKVMEHYSIKDKIIIEGTQGYGLSVYHSQYYPYATSRDTTAAAFISEVGISPLIVSNIIMVIRTFPIRVGGNSGPLPYEIDWETVRSESNYPYKIQEYTSVTKRLRRVARFDIDIVEKAVSVNRPTEVALMGTDYLDYINKDIETFEDLTQETKSFIYYLEERLGIKVNFIGIGPMDEELIDRKIMEVVKYS